MLVTLNMFGLKLEVTVVVFEIIVLEFIKIEFSTNTDNFVIGSCFLKTQVSLFWKVCIRVICEQKAITKVSNLKL